MQGMQLMWWGGENVKKAEVALRKADVLLSKVLEERPADPRFRTSLAGALTNLGVILRWTQRLAEAETAERRALRLDEGLAADFPDVPGYQKNLADILNNLSITADRQGRLEEAGNDYRK